MKRISGILLLIVVLASSCKSVVHLVNLEYEYDNGGKRDTVNLQVEMGKKKKNRERDVKVVQISPDLYGIQYRIVDRLYNSIYFTHPVTLLSVSETGTSVIKPAMKYRTNSPNPN
ncbi:hypothetical protein [Sphingobacterium tabacisoli]|uniref:Uncharacterized protein n=1 Tax=Sphingobacterium tabacisoli TaxID=2044855 RepID=A0ABW5L1Y6_9SPHI|nr:hypothetical protein [Sphingobacterium tabacisoli]